jgi:hypothetical protein
MTAPAAASDEDCRNVLLEIFCEKGMILNFFAPCCWFVNYCGTLVRAATHKPSATPAESNGTWG